jgi:hypothetical protein
MAQAMLVELDADVEDMVGSGFRITLLIAHPLRTRFQFPYPLLEIWYRPKLQIDLLFLATLG